MKKGSNLLFYPELYGSYSRCYDKFSSEARKNKRFLSFYTEGTTIFRYLSRFFIVSTITLGSLGSALEIMQLKSFDRTQYHHPKYKKDIN